MNAFLPIVLLVVLVGTDAWVFLDSKRRADEGAPVSITIGSVHIDTPDSWVIACLVLWLIFFPLYLAARA